MSLETNIRSNLDDVIGDFIESLMSFNKPFYERLREYAINVIGSGNLGKPYVLYMASELAKSNSMIKRINWLTREYTDKNGDLKTDTLRKCIDDHFSGGLSNRKGKNVEAYEKIKANVLPIGYESLSELREIIRASEHPDTTKYGNLTVILADYNTDFLFNEFEGKKPGERLFVAKTRKELEAMDESKIMLNARTLSYKNLQGVDECIESLIETQQRIDKIRKSVDEFCNMTGITPSRFSILPQSLIGNMAIAKAFEGYTGTVINMTNPVEAITQQFAYHSKMPRNKIFAPIENDYCRLNVIIRNTYQDIFGERFNGTIISSPIYGQHNELMEIERDKISFNGVQLDDALKERADEFFRAVKENWRNYGTVHKLKYGVVCPDTVLNSLIPATIMIVYEQNSEPLRGCIYNKDYGIFTGGDFKLQRGHAIPEDFGKIELLPKELRETVKKGMKLDHELTEKLSQIDDITGLKVENSAKIPEVSQEHKMSADKYIRHIVTEEIEGLKNGKDKIIEQKIPQLDLTAYFRPARDSRIINQYKFAGSNVPVIKPYSLMISGTDAIDTSHELQRTKIKSFGIDKDRLILLAVRQRQDSSRTFYINEYDIHNGDTPISSKHFDYTPGEGIRSMALNNNTYLLMNDAKGQYIALFDGKIRELCRTPKELSGIIPYNDSILGYTNNEYYQLGDKMKLVHKSKFPNNGRVAADSINNMLYYVVYNDDILKNYSDKTDYSIKKDVMAQDLDSTKSRIFQSDPNGFDIYSDRKGIQVWTTIDDKILLSNFDDKKALFENSNVGIYSNDIALRKHYLQAIRRDMAILHHEEKTKLVTRYDNRIQVIPLKSLDDCQPNGVFI